jgi:hypothetical protein
MKRVLILSDLHAGSMVGLTPPGWWVPEKHTGASRTKRNKFARAQRECWAFYESSLKKYGPFDVLLVNGDMIDGTGWRSGGTEQITTDREEQCEMAAYALRKPLSSGTKIVCTYGTASHTGTEEDWENIVSGDIGAVKIGSHEWVTVEGVTFDLKHHVGNSSIPHGRFTQPAKERLWNVLWSERKMAPKADIIVRSHVHHFDYCGEWNWLAMTTPALQGMGTKYGSRRCNGTVDFGFIVVECNKGNYTWHPVIAQIQAQAARAIQL